MKPGIRLRVVLAVLAVALYTVRAGVGWVGGISYTKGRRLAAAGAYEQALPHVERATVGFHRSAMLWLAGQVRMGIWQNLRTAEAPIEDSELLMIDAYRDYTEAISLSPASGWYWASLGDLYHQRERVERYYVGLQLDRLGPDRWGFLGRSGRVAVGMTRIATEREPNVYVFYDQLAFILLDYGFREEALEAVRRSAEALPAYWAHAYRNLDPAPRDVREAFLEASRAALGRSPSLRRVTHLISLGKLELSLGRYEDALVDLRASLEEPGRRINRAGACYYIGRALTALERYDEAEQFLLMSQQTHENYEELAVAARGDAAREDGRLEEALERYREARRLRPRNVRYALVYARVAMELEDWGRAEEALRWAMTIDPRNPLPLVALIEAHVAQDHAAEAVGLLKTLERLEGTEAQVQRLRIMIDDGSEGESSR